MIKRDEVRAPADEVRMSAYICEVRTFCIC
jgi:hypothetical protein